MSDELPTRDLERLAQAIDGLTLVEAITAMARDLNTMSNAVSNLDERMERIEAELASTTDENRERAARYERALHDIVTISMGPEGVGVMLIRVRQVAKETLERIENV